MTEQKKDLKSYLINSANATNKLHWVATEMNTLVLSLLAEIQTKEEWFEWLRKKVEEANEINDKNIEKIRMLEKKIEENEEVMSLSAEVCTQHRLWEAEWKSKAQRLEKEIKKLKKEKKN